MNETYSQKLSRNDNSEFEDQDMDIATDGNVSVED